MADSVGKGIALGERFKYDTTSGTSALNNAVQYKIASDKKKEADAVSSLDFKIDMNQWLPVYGKAAAEKQAEVYNKYLQYKSEDKNTAYNRIQQDIFKARQELGRLAGDNERAKKYLSQKEGLLRNAKVDNALTSTETNLADLAKLSDGRFFNIGANGEFAFRPVEVINPASIVKYDAQDYNKVMARTRPSKVPGKMDVEYVEELNPDAVRRNAEALMATPGFVDNVVAADPSLFSLPEKDILAASYDAAFNIASKLKRSSQSEWRLADLPNATSSGSGSEDDKRVEPVEGGESTESLSVGKTDGKEVRKDVYFPWSYDFPDAPETSIPLDSRVIDYATNKFLSGEDIGKVVTFKPKKVYPQLMKQTGKTELYVIGTAYVEQAVGNKEKVVKEFNYKVPYDKVKPAIATKYKLNKVDEKFKNTNLTPAKKQGATSAKKEIKASDISSRAKAAGYTDQEYRKLLTEKGVKIIE